MRMRDEAPTLQWPTVKPPAEAAARRNTPALDAARPERGGTRMGERAAHCGVEGPEDRPGEPCRPNPASQTEGVVGKAPADTTIAARSPKEADDGRPRSHTQGVDDPDRRNRRRGEGERAARQGARAGPQALAAAKPITEKVQKGDASFYRARFAGLDPTSAESACRSLKRNGFSCFTAHD